MSAPVILENELLHEIHNIQLELLKEFAALCEKNQLRYWIDFGTLLGAVRHQGHFIPWDDDLDISMPREDFQKFLSIAPEELPDSIFLQTAATDPFYDIYMVEAKLRDKSSLFIEFPKARFHQGVYIDIFPYDKTFSDRKKRAKHQRSYKNSIVGFRQNVVSELPWWKDMRPMRKKLLTLLYRFIDVDAREKKILDRWKEDESWVWRPTLASKGDDTPVKDADLFPLKKIDFEGIPVNCPNNCEAHLTALYGDWQTPPPKENQRPAHCRHVDLQTRCDWTKEQGYSFNPSL